MFACASWYRFRMSVRVPFDGGRIFAGAFIRRLTGGSMLDANMRPNTVDLIGPLRFRFFDRAASIAARMGSA